jgi:hypothetical protein
MLGVGYLTVADLSVESDRSKVSTRGLTFVSREERRQRGKKKERRRRRGFDAQKTACATLGRIESVRRRIEVKVGARAAGIAGSLQMRHHSVASSSVII